MDQEMKLYSEIVFNNLSTTVFLKNLHNPVREYEKELVEGAIVDFGCGQTSFLLDYADSDRDLFAVDDETSQLDMLEKRVNCINDNYANWNYVTSNFYTSNFPNRIFSLMFFSNTLHFFSLEQCQVIVEKVIRHSVRGTLIYISVHSDKHYANNSENLTNNDYFKHYFSSNDLSELFNVNNFERIYNAEIEKIDSKLENELTDMWLEKSYELQGITSRKIIDMGKRMYFENSSQSDIINIFRRI